MSYFHFTCGNFTTGRGHYINNSKTPTRDILEKLEEKGERNCNVIIERYSYPTNDKNINIIKEPSDFSYEITSRWYTDLINVGTITSLITGVSTVKSYLTNTKEE